MKNYALIKAISASGIQFQGEPPENIQWMPPGKHTIKASRGDEPVEMDVNVTAEAVEALNKSLEEIKAGNYEAYIDFNHEDREASGWVDSFYWGGDDPTTGGIRAKVRWTENGASALKGGSFKRFSPTFLTDAKGRIIGTTPNAGGLVNRPAFRQIASVMQASESEKNHLAYVSASYQPEDECANNKPKNAEEPNSMNEEEKKKMQDLEAENKELKAKVKAMEDDKKEMEAKAKAVEVNSLIKEAITEGKIMAKDEGQIKAITALANADLENAKAFIGTLPKVVDAKAGMFQRIVPGQGDSQPVTAQDRQAKMNAEIASIKAKNPSLTGEQAFEMAAEANPALFSVNA